MCFHSPKLCQAQSSPESHGGAMPLPFTSVWGSQDGARSDGSSSYPKSSHGFFSAPCMSLHVDAFSCFRMFLETVGIYGTHGMSSKREKTALAFAVDSPATETTNSLVVIFRAPFISLHNVNARVNMDIAGSLVLVLAVFHPQAGGLIQPMV